MSQGEVEADGAVTPSVVLSVGVATALAHGALRGVFDPLSREAARDEIFYYEHASAGAALGVLCASVVVALILGAQRRPETQPWPSFVGACVAAALGLVLLPVGYEIHGWFPSAALALVAVAHVSAANLFLVSRDPTSAPGVAACALTLFGVLVAAQAEPRLAATRALLFTLPIVAGCWIGPVLRGPAATRELSLEWLGSFLREDGRRLALVTLLGFVLAFLWEAFCLASMGAPMQVQLTLSMSAALTVPVPVLIALARLRAASGRARAAGLLLIALTGVLCALWGLCLFRSAQTNKSLFEVFLQLLPQLWANEDLSLWLLGGAWGPLMWLGLSYTGAPLEGRLAILVVWIAWPLTDTRSLLDAGGSFFVIMSAAPQVATCAIWELREARRARVEDEESPSIVPEAEL